MAEGIVRRLLTTTALLVLATSTTTARADSGSDDSSAPVESTLPITARVRLTFYMEAGRTFSGEQTYPGSTACSWNWNIGQRFRFAEGEIVTCNDRGMLGWAPGWLDVWRQPWLVRKYGPWATVEILP